MSPPTLTSRAMVPHEGTSNSILRISGLQKLQVSTNNKCHNMKTSCPKVSLPWLHRVFPLWLQFPSNNNKGFMKTVVPISTKPGAYCAGFCHISAWINHGCTCVPPLLNLPPTCHSIPPLWVTEHLTWAPWVIQQISLATHPTYGNLYWYWWTFLQGSNGDMDRANRHSGEGEGGRNWENLKVWKETLSNHRPQGSRSRHSGLLGQECQKYPHRELSSSSSQKHACLVGRIFSNHLQSAHTVIV